ncbi:MAG: DinB family protein [Methylovirgula sp.]
MKSHWQMFAAYNGWANTRIYEAAAKLSDQDYRADCGAFFKSVHGTLNHLLVTDRIWMARFIGASDAPSRLDSILFETLPELRAARAGEDQRIIAFIDGLDEAALSKSFRYRAISTPTEFEQVLSLALAHWFNHQTHHRGQVHGLLTRLTGARPELDLLAYQRAAGIEGVRRIA